MSGGLLDLPPEQGGPPAEARQHILAAGTQALDGIVDPDKREEAIRRIIGILPLEPTTSATTSMMRITATSRAAPIPDPAEVEHYERIERGTAKRLFDMADRDQRAAIASNTRSQWLGFSYNVLALLAGAGGLVAILFTAYWLAERGHERVAIAIVGLGVSGVVGAFVNARFKRQSDPEKASHP